MEESIIVSNAINIFMLPDIYLEEGSESAMVVRWWYTVLGSNMLTSYADTATLMTKQRISPIIGWEGAANMI